MFYNVTQRKVSLGFGEFGIGGPRRVALRPSLSLLSRVRGVIMLLASGRGQQAKPQASVALPAGSGSAGSRTPWLLAGIGPRGSRAPAAVAGRTVVGRLWIDGQLIRLRYQD